MYGILKKLFSLLDARERRRGMLVFGLLIIVALVDVLGVASIMPFIAVLADPEVIETNHYLAVVYNSLALSSRDEFLIFLGFVFFVVLIGSLVLRALGAWAQLRFSQNRNFAWGTRLIARYLNQPYEWYLSKHSSSLANSVLA